MTLDGNGLTPAIVAAVARYDAPVELDPAALERARRARGVVDDAVARGLPVYGLTTGLGPRVTHVLPEQEVEEFSVRTLRGRANSVGRPLPRDVVRAALLVRCNGLARGGSAVRPVVLEQLTAMLNRRLHPVVPETGSIGAGDLGQMAHVGLVVIGEGTAEFDEEVLPGGEALSRAGLCPVALAPGEGLALCNSSAASAGSAALVYDDARKLLGAIQVVVSLSLEGFRANTSPFDARVQAARPVPGVVACAAQLRELLAGGSLLDTGSARRLQDPLSFRCVTQVHGALHTALGLLAEVLDPELNGSGDNPLVLAEDELILSTGNFHTTGMALALDTLALALYETASVSAQRTHRLLAGSLTDLPENLTPHGAERSGYAPLIKTSQALLTELRHLATPVSIDPRPGAALVEDDSSGAPTAARRDARMIDRLRYVLAIEALVAAQAVDLAAPASIGVGPAALHRAVRALVPRLDDDRPSGPDVDRLAAEVLGTTIIGELLDAAGVRADWTAAEKPGW